MYLTFLFLQHTPADCPGCFWSWFLWMLAAFALGLGIGRWIWGKYELLVKQKNIKLKAFKSKNDTLEKDFVALKYQLNESEKDNKGLKASLADSAANIVVLSTQLSRLRQESKVDKIVTTRSKNEIDNSNNSANPDAKKEESTVVPTENEEKIKAPVIVEKETSIATTPPQETTVTKDTTTSSNLADVLAYSSYLKNNNLKVIEGIGPKIEGILNKSGYNTWKDLANADSNTLKNIMHDAGPRYRIHSPRTWQKQIQFCLEKDWSGLIDFQQKLFAEKTNQETSSVLTKVEKVVAKKLGFIEIERNDLKIIEGIGPKIEGLLKIGKIKNWEDLAEAPLERIEKILEDGGDRFKLATPSSWSTQAKYALTHNWVKLKQYQDQLINGQS